MPRAFSRIAIAAALALLSAVSSCGESAVECAVPAASVDNWTIASQKDVGLRPARLCALIGKLDASPSWNMHAVLVVRDGKLVFEHYRRGHDQAWGRPLGVTDHDARDLHDVRSITKSIVSILFGIALDRKILRSVDEPVMGFFPELAGTVKDKDGILVRHLLTMSSGIAWDENIPNSNPLNSETQMDRSSEPSRYVLEQPMATEPGKTWNYSGGSTALLAEIVQRATRRPLSNFAREYLFEPLGIEDFQWVRTPGGTIAAASGIRLRPRDMAKIGQMVLAGGEWRDRRIVSQDWIEESTRAHLPADEYRYGYQWWIVRSDFGGRKLDWFEAYGYGAQRIIVVPELKLVAVIATGMYGNKAALSATTEIFEKFILPAALPE